MKILSNLYPTLLFLLLAGFALLPLACDSGNPTTDENSSPNQPTNTAPSNNATDVSLTPTLSSTIFSDPDIDDNHTASQWQITTTQGDYSDPVYDSEIDASHKIRVMVPESILTNDTIYYWRVRHKDSQGNWSAWSIETAFSTITSIDDEAPIVSEGLLQSIQTAGEAVNSYRFEGTMSTSSSLLEFDISIDYDGAIDVENMNIYMTMSGDTPDGPMEMEMYLFMGAFDQGPETGIIYARGGFGEESTEWESYYDVPYSEWETQDQFALQLETLPFAEVRHGGSETVDGIECYIFDILLDTDEYVDFLEQQPAMEDMVEEFSGDEFGDAISDITIREWVAKDTNLVVKAETQLSFMVEEDTMEVSAIMSFYDYDSPLDIVIPEAVLINSIGNQVAYWLYAESMEVEYEYITTDELRTRWTQDVDEDADREQAQIEQEIFELLGLMTPDQSLYDLTVDYNVENILGFYDTEEDKIYIVERDEGLGASDELTFAHEYAHAAQDCLYDLDALLDSAEGDSDRRLAIRAAFEGHATLVEYWYLDAYFDDAKWQQLEDEWDSMDIDSGTETPRFLKEFRGFPYDEGFDFIVELESFEDAFIAPPVSTEQILHPIKYYSLPDYDAPREVDIPDLSSILGNNWSLAYEDIFGEFWLKNILLEYLSEDDAGRAAAGWDGDWSEYWKSDDGSKLFVIYTTWDSYAEGDEFFQNYVLLTDLRFGEEARVLSGNSSVWWHEGELDLYLQLSSTGNVYVWISDDTDVLTETIDTVFPTNATFTATPITGETPLAVQFTDETSSDITNWEWDFDSDGTVDSTERDPWHTYNPGTYSVTLKVTGPAGSDTNTIPNSIVVASVWDDGIRGQSGSWNMEVVDSQGDIGRGISLSLDNSDNPSIAYDTGSDDLKFARWNGSTWDIEMVDTERELDDPFLAFDNNGNPAISCYDDSNYNMKLVWWNGSTWDAETVDAGEHCHDTSLAFDNSSNPAISYYDYATGDLKFAWWNGSSWGIEIVDSDGNVGRFSSLAFDNSGNPTISYYDETNGDLKLAWWNGSTWDIETVDSEARVGKFSSLAFDNCDNPAISYYDDSNEELKITWWNGSTWDIETVDSDGDVGKFSSLAFDNNSNPAISFYDDDNDDLKYAWLEEGEWKTGAVDMVDNVGKHCSLIFDSNGNPAISYCDETNGDLKYAYWESD
ncbi:PKD domain-containing protein [Chloroflexota bacterium]